MKEHEHMDDPLKEAPLLRSLKGASDPFVVSDEFFDRFPHIVQARLVKKQIAVARGIWSKRLALSLGVIAIIFALWWALPVSERSIEDPINVQLVLDVSPQELLVDGSMIWDVYAHADQPLFGAVKLDLDENELFAYLEYENVDVELLMEEL
jgi:hypothetical protein